MAIITLISDWGENDYYVAAVKGTIFRRMPEAKIVDITHGIRTFEIAQAAYVLRNAYPNFPDGTIHIIGMKTEESIEEPHTVIYHDKQYFIGTDNGFFSLLFEGESPEKIFELDILQESESFTFSSRDRFAKAAVHLAGGGKIEELGSAKESVINRLLLEPTRTDNGLRGIIVHIDNYQNLITNISKTLFTKMTKKKPFVIEVRGGFMDEVSDSYSDVLPGSLVAIFSSNGMLEIAMNQGKAASLLGIKEGDAVIIEVGE